MDYKAPRGTKDLSPKESYKWQYVEETIRRILKNFHYGEIRTPIFEHTELFLRSVGDTTDVVQKEMYTFLDKGERSITLRPEGTAGAVRSFIESGLAAGPQPTKMYYLSAPVFRYENPQAGRLRQHHQFGVEVFGAPDPSADAEVINLAYTVFHAFGIHDLALNINSIGCKHCRPDYNKALVDYYSAHKGALCETCLARLEKNPLRLLDCKEEKCQKIAEEAPKIIDYLCPDCKEHFDVLKEYLDLLGISYAVNPRIVRGLDYYSKTVFEIVSTAIGSQGTVCGGGRYDGLVEELGGPAMAGIGFGMGIERLLMVMEKSGAAIPAPAPLTVFLCPMGKEARKLAFSLVNALRAAGVPADMDHAGRSMKAQFKYADKIGAQYTLALGENELASGRAQLKDMETGETKEVLINEPLGWF